MKPDKFIVRSLLPAILFMAGFTASAQAVMTTTGNWDNGGNWSAGNIGDALAETVTINNSVSPTVTSTPVPTNFTVGNTTLVQDNNLTVEASSSLTVGASGSPRNLTTNLNPTLTINGVLEIWGDLVANNNIIFNISGTVHIHGNLAFSGAGTNATVQGSGNLIVDGDMTGGNNVNFTVNGQVDVFGSVNIGTGSNLNGAGIFRVHGSCTGTPFCSSGILPVELLYFKSRSTPTNVELVWATASELDVDYFNIEKSFDGKSFYHVGNVAGMGNSHTERMYTFTDEKPAAGTSYFRLSEVSRGGIKRTLSIIRINFDGSKSVAIYPNPAVKDHPLSFSLNFNTELPHEITVFDTRGVVMGKAIMNGSEATIPFELGAGVYIVRIASTEFSSVQRIVVQ